MKGNPNEVRWSTGSLIEGRHIKGHCIHKITGCPFRGNMGACCEPEGTAKQNSQPKASSKGNDNQSMVIHEPSIWPTSGGLNPDKEPDLGIVSPSHEDILEYDGG